MKKITTWMLAAILVCGSSVFIACSESDNPTPKKEPKQRQEFVNYANNMLKNMASNTNFGGWEACNQGAKHLFKFVLDNEVFSTKLEQAIVTKMKPTIKPVEEGSELHQMGFTMSGEMDFVDFNTKFTVLDQNTVTVEESDGFELETYDVGIAFNINGREVLNTSALFGNVSKINWQELGKCESFVEFCTKLMQSVEMKDLTISMMNDATMQMAISDCGEMIRLNAEMIYARNHGADQATIEEYTKQMNKLMVGGKITIGSLNMFLPLQLKTTLMGVDYNPVTAVKFVDENDYVAIVDLLDLQATRYWTNIKEHTAAPMQQSVEVIMQLTGFLNEISGNIFQFKE